MINNGIPVSISLNPTLQREGIRAKKQYNKKRLFQLSIIAVLIAICISFIAKLLVYVIVEISLKLTPFFHSKLTPPFHSKLTPLFQCKLTPQN